MKRILIFMMALAICSALPVAGIAQKTRDEGLSMSIDQAVEIAMERSYEIEHRQMILARQRAIYDQMTLPPNPVVSYYQDALKGSAGSIGEWSLTAEYPLMTLFTRGSRVEASGYRLHAEDLRAGRLLRQLRFDVQRAFLETWKAREQLKALREAETILRILAAATKTRAADGDISPYAARRIGMEVSRLNWELVSAEQHARATNASLALLMTMLPDSLLDITLRIPEHVSPQIDEDTLVSIAIAQREDLLALRSEQLAFEEEASWQGKRWLEDLRVGGGYKVQSDYFRGPVFTISLGLPMFDRGQKKVAQMRAEDKRTQIEIRQLERSISSDVHEAVIALLEIQEYARQVHTLSSVESKELIDTAALGYTEGEFTLVEYIDAVSTYIESTKLAATVRVALLESLFRIEHVLGTSIQG